MADTACTLFPRPQHIHVLMEAKIELPPVCEVQQQTTRSAINYEGSYSQIKEEQDKRTSELRNVWDNTMKQGKYSGSADYNDISVLMLSWDKKGDDLRVHEEVNALKEVLERQYHYDVQYTPLQRFSSKKTQVQLNRVVATWVDEHDKPNSLLVVYFAGHGADYDGNLVIAGKSNPLDARKVMDRVTWNTTEVNLQDTHADVLQIFDCCSAGTLGSETGRGGFSRAYEYLGATQKDQSTPIPGPDSFTTALTWALKDYAQRPESQRRFTTNDLRRKIKEEAPGFSNLGQRPTIKKNAKHDGAPAIILHPLLPKEQRARSKSTASLGHAADIQEQETLTLKFVFDKHVTDTDLETLGSDINDSVVSHNLKVNRIIFGGLVPSMAMQVVNVLRERRASRLSELQRKQILEGMKLFAPSVPSAADAFKESIVRTVEHELQPALSQQIHEEVQERAEKIRDQLPMQIHMEMERQQSFTEHTTMSRARSREISPHTNVDAELKQGKRPSEP